MTAKILIVDDEAAMGRSLGRLLHSAGYTCVTTEQAHEALVLLAEHSFDVAIFDVLMPDLDGISLLKLAREVDPHLPVILVTADPQLVDSMAATAAGAIRYMPKPIDHAELLSAIAAGIRTRRALVRFGGSAHRLNENTGEFPLLPADTHKEEIKKPDEEAVNLKLGGFALTLSPATANFMWKGLKWLVLAIVSALAGFGGYHGSARYKQVQQRDHRRLEKEQGNQQREIEGRTP